MWPMQRGSGKSLLRCGATADGHKAVLLPSPDLFGVSTSSAFWGHVCEWGLINSVIQGADSSSRVSICSPACWRDGLSPLSYYAIAG